ncbi:extensin [Iris pallida]|uniref:Extensin n=1 Tax=Iris pallida TaxID=29817 RepID=A0AAX6HGV4_IRIPA|nr:extensin [Iris pallida]
MNYSLHFEEKEAVVSLLNRRERLKTKKEKGFEQRRDRDSPRLVAKNGAVRTAPAALEIWSSIPRGVES